MKHGASKKLLFVVAGLAKVESIAGGVASKLLSKLVICVHGMVQMILC